MLCFVIENLVVVDIVEEVERLFKRETNYLILKNKQKSQDGSENALEPVKKIEEKNLL